MSFSSPLDPGQLLAQLCSIPSPSLKEKAVADFVVGILRDLGLDPACDDAADEIGGEQGNLLVRIPGASDGPALILAAHLDTVPPPAELVPRLAEGEWRNAGDDGILGIDNKAAVAAILTAAGGWVVAPPAVPVWLMFTVAEEIGLLGASRAALPDAQVAAAFVFDHPSPIGTYVSSSPSLVSIEAEFTGTEAHAGVAPDDGASAVIAGALAAAAMPRGRVSPTATANVGVIAGGTASNVVAARCRLAAEVRSSEPEELAALTAQVADAFQGAAGESGCAVDSRFETLFSGYSHGEDHAAVVIARRALESVGREPVAITSAGGSDANAFEARGIPSCNLGDGSLATHTRDERIAASDLELLVELVRALPAAAC